MSTIRPATSSDYDAICALYGHLDELHREAHPDRFQRVEPSRSRTWLADVLSDPERTIFVAQAVDEVVGFADIYLRRLAADGVHVARTVGMIDGLVVAADHRGTGLGVGLLTAATDWFTSRAVDDIELSVYAFNEEALRFYEVHGFRPLVIRLGKVG